VKYIPVSWTVWPNGTKSDQDKCPTRSRILGTFVFTNVAVAVISILLGHRLVTKKLSCGLLGHRDSTSYLYLWIPSFGLQLGANAIIAVLIKNFPGYQSGFGVGELTLFLCVRPRMNWQVAVAAMQYARGKKRAQERAYAGHWIESQRSMWTKLVSPSTESKTRESQAREGDYNTIPRPIVYPVSRFDSTADYLSKPLPNILDSNDQRQRLHTPVQIKDPDYCYYSSAMTVIFSELVLQLFAAYTMARTWHVFYKRFGWFSLDEVSNDEPYATSARQIFIAAVMWFVAQALLSSSS
jgi:hypothetical protein